VQWHGARFRPRAVVLVGPLEAGLGKWAACPYHCSKVVAFVSEVNGI
jgi:hypothetical protein